jgi:hypothetical protein
MILAKICSVMRGMIPFISWSSMLGPWEREDQLDVERETRESLTIIVWDLPEPVWPYAKTVPLYPSITSAGRRGQRKDGFSQV